VTGVSKRGAQHVGRVGIHLLFGREKRLVAQRFNFNRAELVGDSFSVEDLSGRPALTASPAGMIAYRVIPPDAGQRQLVWFDRTGRQIDKVVYSNTAAQGPSLSHDGRRVAVYQFNEGNYMLFNSLGQTTGPDLWAVPLDGDRKPFEVVRTEFNEGLGQFSPDGKWIAYQSDKTGREEIYLRPFPGLEPTSASPATGVRRCDGTTTARSSSMSRPTID